MDKLIAPLGIRTGIFRCLKSGVNSGFPEQGTPQGGVISPLLANIALNGIEEIHPSVRYADDMVIVLKPLDDAEQNSENKHINVKGEKSPYDGDLTYWSERNSKLYDGITSKVLKRQNHSCAKCGLKTTSEERVHLHHKDGNHHNWRENNLEALHESCHDYLHMSKGTA